MVHIKETKNGCKVENTGADMIGYIVTLPSGSKRVKSLPSNLSDKEVSKYFEDYTKWAEGKYPKDFE